MFTVQNYFDNLRGNLEYFPRHSETEKAEVIFTIYTNGILPDLFFEDDVVPYKKSGKILVECSKISSSKIFTVNILFENYEDNMTFSNLDIYQAEEYQQVWDFSTLFVGLIEERRRVHILSTRSNSQLSEKHIEILETWMKENERIDKSG